MTYETAARGGGAIIFNWLAHVGRLCQFSTPPVESTAED